MLQNQKFLSSDMILQVEKSSPNYMGWAQPKQKHIQNII
jgi:hypothetical protein